ncbi:MAG: hypothetical protein KKD63_10170 [Proteobacteria bacterium]|nr:hypothetical protein [Desulfobulbaceae bacterium]MBU4153237.1 hypothetical protein [Pseudomonadota bacterium]MDP2106861.1 hypothetical protein [Desulfobulbaceae bacterium]
MPIFSYLAIPTTGTINTLCAELTAMDWCEIIPAENKEIIILVTDTPDDATEAKLQQQLKGLKSLQSLSMTFGHNDEDQPGKQRGDHNA